MATIFDSDVANEILARIRDNPSRAQRIKITGRQWAWSGLEPISMSLVQQWMDNGFFEQVEGNIFRLSQRGLDYLDGKIRRSDLKVVETPARAAMEALFDSDDAQHVRPRTYRDPKPAGETRAERPNSRQMRPDLKTSDGEDGRALFGPGGTCQLCGQACNPFGWISHAKSRHIAKGDPVAIVERNKKKVAVITVTSIDNNDLSRPGSDATTRVVNTTPKPITFSKPLAEMTPEEILAEMGGKR